MQAYVHALNPYPTCLTYGFSVDQIQQVCGLLYFYLLDVTGLLTYDCRCMFFYVNYDLGSLHIQE